MSFCKDWTSFWCLLIAFISSSKLVVFYSFRVAAARSLLSAYLAFSSILNCSDFAASFASSISYSDYLYFSLSSSNSAAWAAIFWFNFSFCFSLVACFLSKPSTHFYESYNYYCNSSIFFLLALSLYLSSSAFFFSRLFSLHNCLIFSCLSFIIVWAFFSAFSALSVSS